MINILSLGAGVQSSAMLLMAITGEIKHMPDCAIFADTGWEPNYIYDHLNYLEKMAPFPIYRVHNGSLRADILDPLKKRKASLPYYTLASNQTKGMLRRQCTQEYKIMPIDIKIKELLGIKPYQRIKKIKAHLWIGISTDEIVRMKPHHKKYIKNIWPLIDMGFSRADCLIWIEKNGFKIPKKSSCIGCPYHSDGVWRDMKLNDKKSWDDAVKIDKYIRDNSPNIKSTVFTHRTCQPLDEVDLRNLSDLGQGDLFNDECEGLCGV